MRSRPDAVLCGIERACRQVPCRRCGQPVNRYCRTETGRARQTVHMIRYEDAKAFGLVASAPTILPRDGFIL